MLDDDREAFARAAAIEEAARPIPMPKHKTLIARLKRLLIAQKPYRKAAPKSPKATFFT